MECKKFGQMSCICHAHVVQFCFILWNLVSLTSPICFHVVQCRANVVHLPCKWCFSDEQFGRLLVASDLPESNSSRTVATLFALGRWWWHHLSLSPSFPSYSGLGCSCLLPRLGPAVLRPFLCCLHRCVIHWNEKCLKLFIPNYRSKSEKKFQV